MMSIDQPQHLNGYDKLYLLMSKWKLLRLFNPLCYAANVTSIENLEAQVNMNFKELTRLVPPIIDELETVKKMIEDSKMMNCDDLPRLLHFERNNYREQLEAAGVKIIPKEQVSLQSKIAVARPYSGDVYKAFWSETHNNKIEVVVRFDFIPVQRELFIREAKIMTGLHHEYIMKFYGAIVLGPYAYSVGLVVEIFNKGNLEEFPVQSMFHAWLYASQLSSALEYLETRDLVHSSVIEPFVYIASIKKICLGGFMCCCYKEDLDQAREYGSGFHGNMLLLNMVGPQGNQLDECLSSKAVVAMFAELGDNKWPLCCPAGIVSMLEKCVASAVDDRPTFQEIVEILAKEKPVKFCFTTSKLTTKTHELSFNKGEKVWVISQDSSRYHGMWFGQKENGQTGFFESDKAFEIVDDDQVPVEIRARGAEAELAYRNALLEGKVNVCRARLLIIGQDRAGKTSLKKSLIGRPFDPKEPSTDVLEVNPLKFELSVEQVVEWKAVGDDNKEPQSPEDRCVARLVAENMMKKKGEEYQRKPEEEKAESEKREAQLVEGSQPHFDELPQSLTNQASLRSPIRDSTDGLKELPQPKKTRIPIPKELTPLVTDCLRSSSVSKDGNPATETVLDIWDFAGQHLYYVTHPIFFSHRAVYLLVHNMSKDLNALAEPSFKRGEEVLKLDNLCNETNLDMLLSWLVSIHSIRRPGVNRSFVEDFKKKLRCLPPPVLVVGTHADKVSSVEIDKVEAKIEESLKGKTYQGHVLQYYNVDNRKSSDSTGVKAIQAKVQQILSSGLNACADLPVKWFNFEKEVKTLAATKFHLTLYEIRVLAQEKCFIEDNEQLDAMLNYYHDLGVIVRFKDTVIIDTQWLINIFKKLITICPSREQDAVDRHLWEELQNTGVLDMQLISRVFESDDERFKGKTLKQDVLDMMEKYGFLAKFQEHSDSLKSDSSDESEHCQLKYFVPAQLRVSPETLWSLIPQDTDPCPLVFKFRDGFVPHGLFAQLISRLIGRSSEFECMKSPKLYCNGVRFFLGKRSEFDLVLLCSKRSIRLTLRSHCTASADAGQVTENSLAIKVRSLIDKELENLCRQWHWLGNVHYEACVTCLSCQQANVECQRHKSSSCSDLDCQHLLPISNIEPNTLMTCPEQIGDGSRFVLEGLHKWYHCATSEMPAKHDRPLAKASDVDVLHLANDISGQKWKVIGRLLKLKDSKLDEIEVNKAGDVYEQCYKMLITWQRNQESNATCHLLKDALGNQLIMRTDLVDEYCYADN